MKRVTGPMMISIDYNSLILLQSLRFQSSTASARLLRAGEATAQSLPEKSGFRTSSVLSHSTPHALLIWPLDAVKWETSKTTQ